ncbi:division/cell wall cluster transcriptional repressor MraZ [Aestuariimicrobium soli]|uniref:division/cell wall cluster transcriptional repressor MraZ n=1 Tax=Aestuariimicrobium soli TaxID=2035834 RepID=UPI003EBC3B0C
MFLGTYSPKLDEKGRLFLPAKFREALAEGVVVTRQQDRCLAIYPLEAFRQMTLASMKAPSTFKRVRDYQRMLAASASDEVPDKQGRITIPPRLREYAGLDKELVLVGSIDRLEIWDPAAWEAYSAQNEDAFADMNEDPFLGFDQTT